MRVIIAEDESEAMEEVRAAAVRLLPDSIVEAYDNPLLALKAIEREAADIALLDIRMPDLNGLSLGLEFQKVCPDINLIFITAHPQYAVTAFQLRASGYITKPFSEKALQTELENLRHPVNESKPKKPYIRTFGNFELFVNDEPVMFHRSKSKEVLAYLTDRRGAAVTTRELASVLWEDKEFDARLSKYIFSIVSDLAADLESVGAADIIGKRRGELFLYPNAVDCDYFRLLDGDLQARNSFKDEYMTQYSWGEYTLSSLTDYRE